MPTASRILALAALLVVFAPAPCSAEWQFTPFVGYTFSGSTTIVHDDNAAAERHAAFGGTVTLLGAGPIGLEATYLRSSGFFERGSTNIVGVQFQRSLMYTLMGNAVLTTPRSWNRYGLRPYVSGGLGIIHASAEELILPFDLNLTGMNAGGGATGFFTDRVGVRFDLRYFRKVEGPNLEDLEIPITNGRPIQFRFWTASLGVVIKY